LKSVIEVNNEQKYRFLQKIVKALGENVEGKVIGVLGVAFKAGTDDVRESPAIEILNKLLEMGVKVRVYDPMAMENARKALDSNHRIVFCESPYEASSSSDALVITTEWPRFATLDYKKIRKSMKRSVIVDGRNILNPNSMKTLGFKYLSVGRT